MKILGKKITFNGNEVYHTGSKPLAKDIEFEDGQNLQLKFDNGDMQGQKGDTGETGPQGPQGPQGIPGIPGQKGADGLTTSITVNNNKYTHVDGNITLPNYPTLISLGAASISHTHYYAGSVEPGGIATSALTASTLSTARTINGTNFDGSSSIVTSNWGTPRKITIGSTSKTIDGSKDIEWTLSEIGVENIPHTHQEKDILCSDGTSVETFVNKKYNDIQSMYNSVSNEVAEISSSSIKKNINGLLSEDIKLGNKAIFGNYGMRILRNLEDGDVVLSASVDSMDGPSILRIGYNSSEHFTKKVSLESPLVWKDSSPIIGSDGKIPYSALVGVAATAHGHSSYALTSHTHSEYASSSHTHSNYATTSHTHSEYASSTHTHSTYASSTYFSGGSSTTKVTNSYSTANYIQVYGGSEVEFRAGSARVYLTNYGAWSLWPANGSIDLGASASANRWRTIYSTNALQTSDKKYKENITYLNDISTYNSEKQTPFLDFVTNDLKLATYEYISIDETSENDNYVAKKQIGFIANDIYNTDVGKTFLYNVSENENEEDIMFSPAGYTTVIAKALQEEVNKRLELEQRVKALEELLQKGEDNNENNR